MIEMRAAYAVEALVEVGLRLNVQRYDWEASSARALHVILDCCLYDNFGKKNEKHASRDVHFIVLRHGSYYRVWFAAPSPRKPEPKPSDYKMTSDHDSCWRSDGIDSSISHVYFALAKQVNADKAPKCLEQWCTVRCEYVDVTWVPIDLADTYWKRLTKIESVPE